MQPAGLVFASCALVYRNAEMLFFFLKSLAWPATPTVGLPPAMGDTAHAEEFGLLALVKAGKVKTDRQNRHPYLETAAFSVTCTFSFFAH